MRWLQVLWGSWWLGLFTSVAHAQVPLAPDTVKAPVAALVPPASPLPAPPDTNRLSRRLPWLAAGAGATYGGGLYLLGQAWYTGPRVPFHWFDDRHEWRQMDKFGHFFGAFQLSRGAVDMLRWAGVPARRATWYGGFVGMLMQSPIELFDGRAPAYGASASDLAANLLGSAGLLGQQLAWGEVRLMPKFSFHRTRYATLRPNVLGKGLNEQFLKDYNGQTYWLCADVGAWLPATSRWPRWLQPAVGYGAQQMVYNDPDANAQLGLHPYRQYFLSLDVDLRRIPTRRKWLQRVFYVASIFHLPAPALEYNGRRGLVWHGLYY